MSVCYCGHVTAVETRTKVVILQHPREADMPIGTARMASLCLPGAELLVGVDWSESAALDRLLADPARTPILLYPGEGARDVLADPPPGPVTLVVVDGTWWQAKKLVRVNPRLAALPRYAFRAPSPSEYRIRPEPDEGYVSTIEALVHVLGALEGDAGRFRALLDPFRAMIDAQLTCQRERPSTHLRHRRPPRPVIPPRLPSWLNQRREDIVCVFGEANAWRYDSPERGTTCPDELVYWLACRPVGGERFEAVAAPRHPIAPNMPAYADLDPAWLLAGSSTEELAARWRSFLRPGDLLCCWGTYSFKLLAAAGANLPGELRDLRETVREYRGSRVATLEEGCASFDLPAAGSLGRGRAGRRLGRLTALARRLVEIAANEAEAG